MGLRAIMSTPKYDHKLVQYLLILVGMALAALIAAEAVTDGDSSQLVTQIVAVVTPVSALMVLVIRGGEFATEAKENAIEAKATAQKIDAKTDQQTAKLDKIEKAVNGDLSVRFSTIEERIDALQALIEQRLPPAP